MASSRPIPWTERFRPRSFGEVVLSKYARNRIISWWRAWVVLWNLRVIWSEKYASSWLSFLRSTNGKKFWRKHKKSWKEFFLGRYESWIKKASTESRIFKTDGLAEIKKAAKPVLEKWLEETWGEYLTEKNVEDKSIPVPPIPPYKPLLLVGPPGCGKTTTALALANDEGVYVIEFNASDERSRSAIETIVKESSKSAGFFLKTTFPQKPPRLILFDEVDGMSAQKDKGGFDALLRILEDIKIPPILTANVIHDPKVRRLMSICVTVFYDRPRDYEAKKLIKMIASKMKMNIPDDVVKQIIRYAPDFRSIVVALETYYYTGKVPTLWHDRMSSLQDAIRCAFGIKSKSGNLEDSIELAKRYLQESGEDILDLMLTAWENAWKFIEKEETYGFYRALADADYYYKVASRRGNWRVAYLNAMNMLSYAMARYGKPSNIWELRKVKVAIPKLGTIFQKLYNILRGEGPMGRLVMRLARYMHASRRETIRTLPMISHLAIHKPENIGVLFARIGCDDESVRAFLDEYVKDDKIKKSIMETFRKASRMASIRALREEEAPQWLHSAPSREEKPARPAKEKPKAGTLDYFLSG